MTGFIDYLKGRLNKPLPGASSHIKMAPVRGEEVFRSFEPKENARKGAVAVLLFGNEVQYNLLFTLRSKSLRNHSGQISFPGGISEEGEGALETAIREAKEEMNVEVDKLNFIGYLSDLYIPPSNSVITPVLFWVGEFQRLEMNREEVEEYFFYPLEFFADEHNIKREKWDFNGIAIDVPFWDVQSSVPLWGATAMILSELVQLYKEYKMLGNKG